MVRGRNKHASAAIIVNHLKNGVNDTSQFAVVTIAVSLLSKSIEFIEECNQWLTGHKVKYFPQIRGSFTKV